jgi:hypothetical protein
MADAKTPQPLDPHELMKWLAALRRATQPTAKNAPVWVPAPTVFSGAIKNADAALAVGV